MRRIAEIAARPLILIALAVVTISGCSRRSGLERASVGGKVTLDGVPVQEGSIRFVCLTSAPTSGAAIRDGSYYIPSDNGPALGRHRVEISVPRKSGRRVPSPFALAAQSQATGKPPKDSAGAQSSEKSAGPNLNPLQDSQMMDEWVDLAPPAYNTKSTLEVEITSGRNTFDVLMKSK